MSHMQLKEASIKEENDDELNLIREKIEKCKLLDFFLSSSSLTMSDTCREVILGLTTTGLIQLQIVDLLEINTMDSLPLLMQNKRAFEEAYFEVASNLREQHKNWPFRPNSNNADDANHMTFCKKLERIKKIVKYAVTGSMEMLSRFQASNYKYLMKMVEMNFEYTPCSDLSSCSEWPFMHEYSNQNIELAIKECAPLLLRDLQETVDTVTKFVSHISSALASRFFPQSVSILRDTEPEAENTLDATTKILATDLVMEEIFNSLDFESLLSSRLVSREFNRYFIRKSRLSFLNRFRYDDPSKTYLSCRSVNGVHRSLANFSLFLTSTKTELPFSSFSFKKGTLVSKDLIEFFIYHGNRIKELEIDLQYYPDSTIYSQATFSSKVLAKVLGITSFLEKLVLDYLPEYWRVGWSNIPPLFPADTDAGSKSTKLAHLKSLEIKTFVRDSFLSEFLLAGCSLETCSSFQSIIPFFQLNKFHLLKQLWWGMGFLPDDVEFFRTFVDNSIKITSNLIEFGVYTRWWADERPDLIWIMTNAWNKILHSCSLTLEKFCLFTPLSNFPGLNLPCLPKVKELSFATRPYFNTSHYWHISSNRFFPAETNLSLVFPHLHTISFGFTRYQFEALPSWSEAFECGTINENGVLKTVKCIEVVENFELPTGWLQGLSVLCPNVEFIRVDTIFYDFQDAINGLWAFRNAKEIKLNIDVRVAERTPFCIDSAFTGFSVNTCNDLFNRVAKTELESLDILRVNPSLLNLKALESLVVTFVDSNMEGIYAGGRRILTKVTEMYAFDLLYPQLMICLVCAGRTEARSEELLHELAALISSAYLHYPAVTVQEGWSTPFSIAWYRPANQADPAI